MIVDSAFRLDPSKRSVVRLSATAALVTWMFAASATSVLAQKDSRGWDGTSSSMYNNTSSSFAPFGRVSPSSSAGIYGGSSNVYPNPQYTPPANLSFQDQQIRNKQRQQQLMQQQSAQPVNSSILQSQRWESEWRQQHPGQPMPNAGQLQKMHMGEIQSSINNGWAQMRQRQTVKAREEYELAMQLSKNNAKRDGVTWSKAQFDKDFDQSRRDQANAYLESVRQSREISDIAEEQRRARRMVNQASVEV